MHGCRRFAQQPLEAAEQTHHKQHWRFLGGPLPMSNLLVVTFENQEDGRKAHTELKNLSSEGGVNIQDVELVERDAEGKIHRVGKVDETTKAGILGGGILGLLM